MTCHTTWLKCLCASSHPCVMRLSDCLFSLRSSLCSFHCLSLSFTSSWTLTSTFSSSMWMSSERDPLCTSPNEESGPLANNAPFTGYEPNFSDDFHYSETTEIFLQEQSSDIRPSHLHDSEISDDTIGRALSSPLITQEREEPSDRRQGYHSFDESLSSSQSSSVGHRTGRPVEKQFDSQIPNVTEIPSHSSESEQIRILLERRREQILVDCQEEIWKHEIQADYDRRSIQKLNGMIESQKGEIYCAHQGDERLRQDQQLHHEQLLEQNGDLREAWMKSLNEMEVLKRFQGSTFDTISRRRLIEDRDTIFELTAKIQELQNEVHCMNDSRNFNNPTLPVNQRFFYFFRDLGGMLSSSLGMPSRNDRPPSIWDTHGYIRKRFLLIQRRLLQHLIRKSPILGFLMCANIHHRM